MFFWLKIIDGVPDIKMKRPLDLFISDALEKKIKDNWDNFVKDKDDYWDGDLLAVTNYDSVNNVIEVGRAKYSWLIYSSNNNDLDINSLFVSILLRTIDGYYVIIKNNHDKFNIIGGMVEEIDLGSDKFNPDVCLRRELKEELNLDLDNKNHISYYEVKYFKEPKPGNNYGIVYRGVLNFNKSDFISYFEKCKSKFDGEISELLLLNKNEVKLLDLSDGGISYLSEMMEFE